MRSLGLRWRAENIIAVARALVDDFDGRVPDTELELRALPGVGDYVAQAVLCFGFGQARGAAGHQHLSDRGPVLHATRTPAAGSCASTSTDSRDRGAPTPSSTTRSSTWARWSAARGHRAVRSARCPMTARLR